MSITQSKLDPSANLQIHTHTHTKMCTHTHTHARVRAHTHASVPTHARTSLDMQPYSLFQDCSQHKTQMTDITFSSWHTHYLLFMTQATATMAIMTTKAAPTAITAMWTTASFSSSSAWLALRRTSHSGTAKDKVAGIRYVHSSHRS